MIQFQNMRVPVVTQGTSRKQRFIPALEPAYARIDDRSIEELFRFIQEYSRKLKYVNINGEESGNWEAFFEKLPVPDGNCTPHLALVMAFLELFRESQNSLNQLTQKHLDHYYQTILGLKKKESTPDHVHVTVDLAREVRSLYLSAGTSFSAGKDESGNPGIYKLLANTQFTKARIGSVKSLYLDSDAGMNNTISVKAIHGNEVWNEDTGPQSFHALGGVHLPDAVIGFAVTAPILFLQEGNRTIKLVVLINYTGVLDLQKELDPLNMSIQDNFLVECSTASGWMKRKPDIVRLSEGKNVREMELHLQVSFSKSADPIVPLEKNTTDSFSSAWPVMKVTLDPSGSFRYSFFKLCQLITIDIHVHVDDLKNIIIQNNQSVLDINSPFQPFTQNPGVGDDFYIGSHEAFRKNLTSLNLIMDWYHVPAALRLKS